MGFASGAVAGLAARQPGGIAPATAGLERWISNRVSSTERRRNDGPMMKIQRMPSQRVGKAGKD
jgi:hypothetical protein